MLTGFWLKFYRCDLKVVFSSCKPISGRSFACVVSRWCILAVSGFRLEFYRCGFKVAY